MSDIDTRRGRNPESEDSVVEGRTQSPSPTVDRRQALKALGALALTAPSLGSSFGCSDPEPSDDGGQTGDGSGSSSTTGSEPTTDAPGTGEVTSSTSAGTTDPDESSTSEGSDESSSSTTAALPEDPDFPEVTACELTRTDIEGPFRIDEDEVPDDPTLNRPDLRDPGHPGTEFRLHLRILDGNANCAPIPGLKIYIWHTDALGFYSGFNNQNPNQQYTGAGARVPENNDRFARGYQVTDSGGIVRFTSIFPGWYEGRPVHVHVIAVPDDEPFQLVNGQAPAAVFTTQLYFDLAFCEDIMANEAPYNTRPWPATSTSRTEPTPGQAIPAVSRADDGAVVGLLNIIIRQ